MKKKTNAELAADAVVANLRGRRGFGSLWDEIDKATRREIRAEMARVIQFCFDPPPAAAPPADPRQAGLCAACPEYYCGCPACIRRCFELMAGS